MSGEFKFHWDGPFMPFQETLTVEEVQRLLDSAPDQETWVAILRWAGPPPRRPRVVRKKPVSPYDKQAILQGYETESLHKKVRGNSVPHIKAWRRSPKANVFVCHGRRATPKFTQDDNPWAGVTYLNRISRRRREYLAWHDKEE